MKPRDLLALLIAVIALIGIGLMWASETHIVMPDPGKSMDLVKHFNGIVLPALQEYSFGIGLTLVLVSIAYILLGHEEKLSTTVDDIEGPKK